MDQITRDYIQYGATIIDYDIEFVQRKTLGISVNPDGSVGLSTISEWKYENGKAYAKLTQGQNALNLSTPGATGKRSSRISTFLSCLVSFLMMFRMILIHARAMYEYDNT